METSLVHFAAVKRRTRPAERTSDPQEILLKAEALFGTEQSKDLRSGIAQKIGELQHYDVLAMDRAVAILMCGRSGSLLLASYLDGHEDVLMLPEDFSQLLYKFFDRYPSLSLRDKLLASPGFYPGYPRFFEGTFAISVTQYYTAILAILEFCANLPPEFLESRRAFFLFAHIAYNLALGRTPASPTPLIVYAQHVPDNALARHLVEDFPQAKFVHTIRDPISSFDGVFHYHLGWLAEQHILLPLTTLDTLANKDRPHIGMESRTRTIRFEDLHADTAETMRDLSDWLRLRFQPTLVDSTFNGIPYVVKRNGMSWSGRRPQQVQRHSWHFSPKDRALLFAVFYENFVEWDYPCPKVFNYPIVRPVVFLSLVLLPMKMEMTAAWEVFKHRTLPSLRQGTILRAIKSLLAIGLCRLRIICLLVSVFFQRCVNRTTLLPVDHKKQSLGRDADTEALQETK
jgi:hypothetical protein